MQDAEVSQAAILLRNGDALMTGGEDVTYGRPTSTVQRYDVATGKWLLVAPMRWERIGHTATLLKDGRVLVAGGLGKKLQGLNTAEIYDPARNTWTPMARMPGTRFSQSASLLPDGRVLVVGGIVQGAISRSTLLFDPHTLAWKPGPSTLYPHAQQATVTLPDGRILVAGGYGGKAELFDPAKNRWTAIGGPGLRAHPVLTLLPGGLVLFASGVSNLGQPFASAALFNPRTGRWRPAASMPTGRDTPIGVELRDGRVLVAGGGFNKQVLRTAEIYDPRANAWITAAPMRQARSAATVLLLRSGNALVCGGTQFGYVLDSCELYHP
jgi:hypothetical protein